MRGRARVGRLGEFVGTSGRGRGRVDFGVATRARPQFATLLELEYEILREFEGHLAHTAHTVSEHPVGHVDVVAFARVLDDYVVAVYAALAYAHGSFGGALRAQFLRKFLYYGADQVFLWPCFVRLKINLRIQIDRHKKI